MLKNKLQLNTIELFIFDLDGTLIDSRMDIVNAVNASLREIGRNEKSVEEITRLIGEGSWSLIRRALIEEEELFDQAFQAFSKHYEANLLNHTQLFEGAKDTILKLKTKTLVVLSNKRERFCRKILQGLGIIDEFKLVIGGDSLEKKKPDPTPVFHICETLKMPLNKTSIVGDSPVDIQAGKAAGIWTIGLTHGFSPQDIMKKSGADMLFSTVGSMAKYLVALLPNVVFWAFFRC